jgi:uncharacterized protein (DUF2252 family)
VVQTNDCSAPATSPLTPSTADRRTRKRQLSHPTSGLRTELCGDAHLSNFGAYASPERVWVFDNNDFDETLPGPFEWDVKRLVASFVVAGRDNGFTTKQSRKATLAAVESDHAALAAAVAAGRVEAQSGV